MSKHSIRIGSDSRFSTSRSSSSASTRRDRFVSATNVSDCSASSAFCCASSWSRRFSPRSGARTSTCEPRRVGEERLERRRVPHAARHEDLRRDRRRGAVVLEAEPLEHLVELGAGGVLEVERVAVDHPPLPQREHLHGGALGRDRDAEHVDRADRLALDRLPLGQPLDRAQPVAVARRVLEALLARRQRASAPRAAAGSAGRRPTGTRSPGRSARGSPPARCSRRRARSSARCGSRGTGCRCGGPAAAPRTGGSGTRGSGRRASRAPSSRSRTARSRRRRDGAARA